MKPIILLFILIFFPYIVFCQSSNDEYFILTEYYYNDEGKQILIPTDSIEYHRITNKDHSMWGFKNKEGYHYRYGRQVQPVGGRKFNAYYFLYWVH